jgi:hypothetical protein
VVVVVELVTVPVVALEVLVLFLEPLEQRV